MVPWGLFIGLSLRRRRPIVNIQALQQAVNIFGAYRPGAMPVHHVQTFLYIARQGTCTYRDIELELGVSNAGVSRTITSIGSSDRVQESLNLIETYPDPADNRRLRVRLSKKGNELYRLLNHL